MEFIRFIEGYFTFGLVDSVRYNKDFVTWAEDHCSLAP